jgi:restriction endonuclease S subunit
VQYHDRKVWITESAFILNKKVKINNKFLYFLLKINEKKIVNLEKGSVQKFISKQDLLDFEINIPNILLQEQDILVDEFSFLESQIIKERERFYELERISSSIVYFSDYTKWNIVQLKDICTIKIGKPITKTELDKSGKFSVIGGGKRIMGHHSKYNFENVITIAKIGSSGFVNIWFGKVYVSSNCFVLTDNKIPIEIMYCVLKSQEKYLNTLAIGTCQPNINTEELLQYKVFIPPFSDYDELTMRVKEHLQKIERQKLFITELEILLSRRIEGVFYNASINNNQGGSDSDNNNHQKFF